MTKTTGAVGACSYIHYMDLNTLLIFLLGCGAGVITGIMPGIGPAHLLAILYTWMTGWNPVHLMIFYVAYMTISNFVDAIPSLYFGIPGEVSSVPASRESQTLSQQGLIAETLKLSAIGRTVGSIVALVLSFFVIDWLFQYPQIFSSRWQISFYCFTLICILLAGRNHWSLNFSLMVLGLVISAVGYNYYTQQSYATFGWSELYSGLPLLPILIGSYVLPQLLSQTDILKNNNSQKSKSFQNLYLPSMVRGTGVGYVLGLVPGMSFILGSTAAYTLERWWQKKWPAGNASMAAVVASETASNTGSVSLLVPLLLFGIPIIASEAIIYDLMIDAGAVFTLGAFLKNNYITLVAWFAIACVVGLILSWPMAESCRRLALKLLDRKTSWLLILLVLTSMVIEAWQTQKLVLYSLAFVLSFSIGWILRHKDLMPMIFVFVLGPNIQSVIYNLIQLYS